MKLAITNEEKKKCFEFLKEHGTLPSTDLFIFYENGSMQAVAGIEVSLGDNSRVGRIEPLQFAQAGLHLRYNFYTACEWYLRGLGCSHIICKTNKPNVQNTLNKMGYVNWGESLNEVIKEL